MSTIIVITPPPPPPEDPARSAGGTTKVKKIRLELDSDATLADQLRAAADLLDGNQLE